ncbi:NAD(P)/FAD-dependent oxidoreductase [archaeon]|nr:NAD(P)/FAD-dependent oxidoreductase [archaeon]
MVTIVGGGPAGLLCAKEAAYNGKKVVVYEEHEVIGEPVQCAGLVSKKGLDDLGVNYESTVLNKSLGARVYSPSGKEIEIKRKDAQAMVIDRAALDKVIAEEAMAEGAEIKTGVRLLERGADLTVGADGASSYIAKDLGNKKDLLIAYQVTAKLERDLDFVELHFGSWSKDFFAWVIPESEQHCRVGIAIKGDPKKALMGFMKEKNIKADLEKGIAGLIPLFSDNPTVFEKERTLLVGDAAGQVKATTGGGIAIGGFCGRIAGEIIGKDLPLTDYEVIWRREVRKELVLHRQLHDFLVSLTLEEMDELFQLAIEERVPELIEEYGDMDKPSMLFKQLMAKPRVVSHMMKYLSRLPVSF